MRVERSAIVILVAGMTLLPACRGRTDGGVAQMDAAAHARHHGNAQRDSAFAALQGRGQIAMGVDQFTSTHRFDALPDGGRIELQRDDTDQADIALIRAHMREIAQAFREGDFHTPMFVHEREVPGTRVMAERRERIEYIVNDLPRGAELRITTRDPEAIVAIHAFMQFQREDHRAGGRSK